MKRCRVLVPRAAAAIGLVLSVVLLAGCTPSGGTPQRARTPRTAAPAAGTAGAGASLSPPRSPTAAAHSSVTAGSPATQLFNITPRPRTPSPTPEIVPAGVARTVPAGPTPPPGGALAVALSLSEQICSGGRVTVYATVTGADGKPMPGARLTGTVALQDGDRDLRFAASDASGRSSATVDLGRPHGGYFLVWTVQAQAGGAAGAGSSYCQTPA